MRNTMNEVKLNDEQLKFINGGLLVDGWESVTESMIKVYKDTYGDKGLEILIDVIASTKNDPTSVLTDEDREIVFAFIRDNWNKVVTQ